MELEPRRYVVDGKTYTGHLADGSNGRRVPGVVVAHEGAGINEHVLARTRDLAELGTVAFALDLFGLAEFELETAKAIVRELRADRAALRRRARAALEVVAEHPRVDPGRLAGVGFCIGGTAVLELARDGAPLACVVGFHPGLDTPRPEDALAIRGKVLVCVGDRDPIVDAAQREAFLAEMRAASVDAQLIVYSGAGHSFTNPGIDAWGFPGFRYHASADRRSWQAMLGLFEEALVR